MKVYAVTHYWNNGESYEDYDHYEETRLFSTYEKANTFYWDKVTSDYEGYYSFYEWGLDTNEQTPLDESPHIACTPYRCGVEPDYCEVDDEQFMPEEDYDLVAANYVCAEYGSIQEELQAEAEWMEHKGEQYEILESIEQDRLEDELKESDAVWASLGMLD